MFSSATVDAVIAAYFASPVKTTVDVLNNSYENDPMEEFSNHVVLTKKSCLDEQLLVEVAPLERGGGFDLNVAAPAGVLLEEVVPAFHPKDNPHFQQASENYDRRDFYHQNRFGRTFILAQDLHFPTQNSGNDRPTKQARFC